MLKKLVPLFVKKKIQNWSSKSKYQVKLKHGAHVNKSVFEKHCLVGENSVVFNSMLGTASYIGNNCNIRRAKIGRYCSIGSEVNICLGNHPTSKIVSIHPSFYSLNGHSRASFSKQQIFQEHKNVDDENNYVVEIGNDVWIGNRVSIMDGVRVADGAVIATNAVVSKDVDAYSIVGGVPATHIRYRFTEEQRRFLLEFRWWDKSEEWLEENAYKFSDIDSFIREYSRNKFD